MFSTETKTYKLFTALRKGEAISEAKARNRFGIQNIRAEATRIRKAGYNVISQRRKAGNNVLVTEYKLA